MKKDGERAQHWSEQKEQSAGYWHVGLLLVMFRLFPVIFLRLAAYPVALIYYVLSGKARDCSRLFLLRVAECFKKEGKKFSPRVFRHILAFSLTVVEKVEAWGGKVKFERICFQGDDVGDLVDRLERKEGAMLICSHLGNAELLRGLASFNRTGLRREIPVTSIVDFSVTSQFNRMLKELNPRSDLHVISAGDIGPDTVILLQERLEQGGLAVIAGDRTSATTRDKYFLFPFLDQEAPFAYGSFFLAALLNVPVYFVFALRRGDISLFSRYDMYVHKSEISFDCSRQERAGRVEKLARSFAEYLEYYCKQHPYQWYNFYDFWSLPAAALSEPDKG